MIAKIICHGDNRDAARRQLTRALQHTLIDGIRHNVSFLHQVLSSDAFARAELDTRLLELHPELMQPAPAEAGLLALAAALALQSARQSHTSPWQTLQGWRPFGRQLSQIELTRDGESHLVTLEQEGTSSFASVNDVRHSLHWQQHSDSLSLSWGLQTLTLTFVLEHQGVLLNVAGETCRWQAVDGARQDAHSGARHGPFAAPMSGTVVATHVTAGSFVTAGTAVITLEAMKMEHTLRAPVDGTVQALLASAGEQVSEGTLLADFVSAAATSTDA
jgi:3-methylcrotonyl-CoA carboxylase alpha subunit